MTRKAVSVIKHSIVAICLALLLYCVFLAVFAIEFSTSFLLMDILGYFSYLSFFILLVAAFLTPFIIKLRKKNTFKQFLISAALSIAVLIVIILGTYSACYIYLSQFTPDKWEAYPNQHYIMFDDLQKDYELRGMTKEELTELLGEEDGSVYTEDEAKVSYFFRSGFLEYDAISFIFTDGKVSSWEIIEVDPF
ncbi:MAG: hypothetical protein IJP38_05680 [Oscillospiraceae bacterium]|nr:hypothetical protein [Oscillospiraceae bacterium]